MFRRLEEAIRGKEVSEREDKRLNPDELQEDHTCRRLLANSFGRQQTCPPFLFDQPSGR